MSSRESRAVVRGSAHRRRRSKNRPPDLSDLRIVLLGKSVSENSRVGNFLLGRAAFDSEAPPDVVERVGGRLKDRHVMVINSPQLLQTNISDHHITQTVRECVYLSDPGPHVFILVLQHNDFTEEDMRRAKQVLDEFSEEAIKRTIVLTTDEETHDAQGAPVKLNEFIQQLTAECGGGHLQLDNEIKRLISGVSQRLEKILTENSGEFLTCGLYVEGSSGDEEQSRSDASLRTEDAESDGGVRAARQQKLIVVLCGSDETLKNTVSKLIREKKDVELHGRLISLVELPALFNTRLSEEEVMRQTLRCVSLCHPGVHVFLLIVPDAPLNNEDKAEMEEIQRIFSSRINKHMMILIMQNSESQTAELNEETQAVIERFGGRHHVFCRITQVSTLMENIEQMLEENRGEFFSTETFLEAQMIKLMKYQEMKKKIHSLETHLLPQGSRENTDEVRIVLLGKTGVGKSATGNTILGRNTFKAEASFESVTKDSQRETSEINGRHVTVIDTPGLFDTELTNDEIQGEISNCISMILPGPHVFLRLIPLGRFTKHEETSVKIIQETFGEKSLMFTMVLFTRGDDLKDKTIVQCLGKPGSALMKLIEACGNRFHVFNNNQTGDRTQVCDLLEKIDNMVKANGGSFYSCKMFRQMEREKQEQQMKILMDRVREREEEMRQEQETFKNKTEQLMQEKEKVKTEKEKLQIKYDTETERLMNRLENERKKREEEYNEREERYKTLMKEKEEREEKMCEEMKREREEWEKQKLEEKMRREEEDEKRRDKEQRVCDEFNQRLKEERERMEREKEDLQSKHEAEENKMKMMMEKLNREREELMKKHEEEKERMKMMIEEEQHNDNKERKRREEELREREERYKREMKEQEEQMREIRDEMRRERESFKQDMEEMRREKETVKKEKENLQIRNDTEIDRLMKRIENERQNHQTERKRREEEFNEKEKRWKTLMKEKEEREEKMCEEMKREREEWEKQKLEEKMRREEEDEKRREKEQKDCDEFNQRLRETTEREKEDLQSKHEAEENKMKILMEKLNREREELMKKHEEEKERIKILMEKLNREREEEMRKQEEEKERMKILMEEERHNHEKERKRREEDFNEREERYKTLIREREMKEEMKREREEREKQKQQSPTNRLETQTRTERWQMRADNLHHRGSQRSTDELLNSAGARLQKNDNIKIVLLGKTGVGKSSSGNTILGENRFPCGRSMPSVTDISSVQRSEINGRSVSVIDTPGFFNTNLDRDELSREFARSVYLSAPGVHAFLFIVPFGRCSEQEEEILKQVQKVYGKDVLKHVIILFTYGDECIRERIQAEIDGNEVVRRVVEKCQGYHVLNNRDLTDRQQVNDLLVKIYSMTERNGYYTNEMYERSQMTTWEQFCKLFWNVNPHLISSTE